MSDDLISREDLKNAKPEFMNEKVVRDTKYRTIKDRIYAKAWNDCNSYWLNTIKNAPTADITEEQAIDKLDETGWLPKHDKEMTERPQGEWIPVSERLPEDMQRVLIWFEYYRYGDYNCMYQTYGFGYVCDGKWSPFINGETGWQDARIIAWMPLPEPYKEAENEEKRRNSIRHMS